MKQMTDTFNRTISLIAAAIAGAAFVYFLLPGQTARFTKGSIAPIAPTETTSSVIKRTQQSVDRNEATDQLLENLLAECGVDPDQIRRGVYKLVGEQWQENPLRPLLQFQRPRDQDESDFWQRISSLLDQNQLGLAPPKASRQGNRAALRAVTANHLPQVILRALPTGPYVTIVVEGVGHEPGLLESLMALDPDVTFSVDSDSAFANLVSKSLEDGQREIITGIALSSPMGHEQPTATDQLVRQLLDRSTATTNGSSGIDLHVLDADAWAPAKLNEVLSQISERGYFILNRTMIPVDRVERASHRFGLRIGTTTHRIRGDEVEFSSVFRGLDSALAYSGNVRLLVQASPKTLGLLGPWVKTLRKRGVSILRLSEVVR